MKNSTKILSLIFILCMILSVTAVCVFAASPQSITELTLTDYSKIYFKGETDKDFTSYSVGETMTFTMSLYADDVQITAPYFYYTLRGDDGASSNGYAVPDSNGFVTIEASVSVSGAVRLVVQPCNESKNVITASNLTKFEGGAIAGAENIRPTVAEPLDFDEFWADQLSKLDECAPDLFSLEQIESSNANYDAYIVKVNCIGDASMVATNATWTAGVLSVPKDAEAGSLGFQLRFLGYGVKGASQNNASGYVTFTVCAHSIEQLQESSYYDDTDSLGLTNYGFSAEENALPETSYFRGMLLRDIQAVRFLQKYFGSEGGESTFGDIDISSWKGLWNGKDIYTHGSSQGGFQAISVAALVPEVTRIYANVPWFADVAGNTVSSRIQSTFRPTYANGLRYYDTAFMAKRVKATTVNITAGTGDTLCPMYAIQSIYNNLNANVSMIFRQGMTHSNTKTYPVEFTQAKIAGEKTYFGKDSFLISGIDSELVKNTWEVITGMETECYTSADDLSDAVSDKKIGLEILSGADISDSSSVSAAKDEINSLIESLGLDAYAYYFYDISALNNKAKAILSLAADSTSKVYLIGLGEDASEKSLTAALERLSGALYSNQSSAENAALIVDTKGNIWSAFAVADNIASFEACPIYIPYFDMKKVALASSYSSPEETGEEYGIFTVITNNTPYEIKVYSKDSVSAYGDGWLIYNETLYINNMDDSGMGWNSHMLGVSRIEIEEGVTYLSSEAVLAEAGSVISLPYSLVNIDANAFGGETDITIEGYDETAANTFATDNLIDFVSLGAAGECGYGVYWKYKDGILTIFGTGSVLESGVTNYNKHANSAWYAYYSDITKVVIGPNIETVSSHDFHQMTSLTTVEITPNLKVLEQGAFMICPNLSTVYLKGDEPVVGTLDFRYITSLGTYCFDHGKQIQKYIFSDLAGTIGKEAFKANYKLTEFTVPAGVTAIGAEAFDSCSGLKELTVLGMDTAISEYAFANNTSSTATSYINNIKIIAKSGSAAQRFAIDNGLVYRNIDTDEETDYAALVDVSFLRLEGYQVRMDSYNGLRSKFTADLSAIDVLEAKGFKVVEYGTLLAASEYLAENGDIITVAGENGNYSTLPYAVLVTVVENGTPIDKHYIDTETNTLMYHCTIVNFNKDNYNKNVTIRGYTVISDQYGNEFVYYSDYEKEEYRSVSLEMICDGLFAEGKITEDCISYADVLRFRGKDEDLDIGDNEFNEENLFPY